MRARAAISVIRVRISLCKALRCYGDLISPSPDASEDESEKY